MRTDLEQRSEEEASAVAANHSLFATRRSNLRRPALFGAALAVSSIVTVLIRFSFPRELRVRTDIVGYPIHSNFNVLGYFQTYYLFAVFLPILTLILYHLLTRRTWSLRRQTGWQPRLRADLRDANHVVERTTASAGGRLLFVSSVVGIAGAMAVAPSTNFWQFAAGAGIVYAALVLSGAILMALPLRGNTTLARIGTANALGAPVAVLLLGGISQATKVTVSADQSTHHIPWMPVWLALAGTAAVLIAIGSALRGADDRRVDRIEHGVVLLVAGPVALFLLFARLPGPVGWIDFFHDGETLVAARLFRGGAFPWRDLFFIHGLLMDVFRGLVGLVAIDNSHWGSVAGQMLIVFPLYWIFQYVLQVTLFGKNWLFLFLTTALALTGYLTPLEPRFLLYPLLLIALTSLLRNGTWPRAVAFSVMSVVALVLTPELTFAVGAAAFVIVVFEFYYRLPNQTLLLTFRRTIRGGAVGAGAIGIWLVFLAVNGALGSFLLYYRTFAPDHELTGGFAIVGAGLPFFEFAAIAPVVLAVLTFWYFCANIRSRRELSIEDWTMGCVALLTLLYYPKFLSRADGHAYQVLALSLPLFYCTVYKIVSAAEAAIRRRPIGERVSRYSTRHPVTFAMLAVLLVAAPGPSVWEQARRLPASFQAVAADEPGLSKMGFAAPGAVDTTLIDDVGKVLDATLGPDDRLFDMTNEPALFYFLLDAKPVNRYYHVSMAIREHTQQDLLKQLRRDRPKLAAVGGEFGLSSWDGIPNTVRHYEISEYLLRNYRPILSTHKIIFMLRNDAADPPLEPLSKSLSQTPLLGDVLLDAAPCNWGYAPNFFTDPGGPSAGAPGVSIPFRTAPRGNAEEVTLALPPGLRLDRFSRLEIQTSSGLVDDAFVLSADPGDDARAVQFKTLKSDAQRYRVRVGSCPQWYAFSGATLSLRHSPGQQIVAVRLY